MTSLFDTSHNLSIYTIPAAWLVTMAPHFYANTTYRKALSKFPDNRQPRNLAKILAESQSIDSATKDRILRADAAQQNGFENLGLFAAAVIAGNVAGVDNYWLNMLSIGYVSSRIVYNWVYINNTTQGLAGIRSLVWFGGVGMVLTLFVMAGNKFYSLS